jgi:hypothetical protein
VVCIQLSAKLSTSSKPEGLVDYRTAFRLPKMMKATYSVTPKMLLIANAVLLELNTNSSIC